MVHTQACEQTEIAEIATAYFREFVSQHVEVSQLCIRVVAARLGILANRLVYLMADNAEARVAKFLVDFAAHYHEMKPGAERSIGLTHQEVADITGVQRQTATRILGKFTERGALSVRYRKITIRNRDLLARFAAHHPWAGIAQRCQPDLPCTRGVQKTAMIAVGIQPGERSMELVAEKPLTDTIRASFNYIVDTGVPPVRYIDWPEMADKAIPPQYRQYEMSVRNGRPLRDTFKLDTHGFVFAEHRTQVKDFTDEGERKRVYDPEVQALIMKHSGASEVLVFDHTLRISDEDLQKAANARPTVKGVHNDYTEASAPVRLREIVGDAEAERRVKKRWAIIQVWRPIRGKVFVDPLGICDGRSIPRQGFIRVERRYKYRTGEVYHIAHHPAHEWFYFPHMERDEALVFKVFDSDTSKPSRFTAHSAFDDPSTPADAPPRESIETRTFAFFD